MSLVPMEVSLYFRPIAEDLARILTPHVIHLYFLPLLPTLRRSATGPVHNSEIANKLDPRVKENHTATGTGLPAHHAHDNTSSTVGHGVSPRGSEFFFLFLVAYRGEMSY